VHELVVCLVAFHSSPPVVVGSEQRALIAHFCSCDVPTWVTCMVCACFVCRRKSRSLGRYTGGKSRDLIIQQQQDENLFVPGKKMGRGARFGAYLRKKRSISRKGAAVVTAEPPAGLDTQSEDLPSRRTDKVSPLLGRSRSCDSVRTLLRELGYGYVRSPSLCCRVCQSVSQSVGQ
jgi:hypothetical protein